MATMNQEQFITEYCQRSGITTEFFAQHFITLPCDACGYQDCDGWAAMVKNPMNVRAHIDLCVSTRKLAEAEALATDALGADWKQRAWEAE